MCSIVRQLYDVVGCDVLGTFAFVEADDAGVFDGSDIIHCWMIGRVRIFSLEILVFCDSASILRCDAKLYSIWAQAVGHQTW